MNWYKGNIAEAVALSKTKNAIFVVYVEGKDGATKTKLGNLIDDARIREKLETDDFVAIKIEGDSDSYMQFARIYQIVPIPSIFFIGKAGTPLDIATGILNNVEELEDKIAKVMVLAGKKESSNLIATNEFIKEESKASTSTAGPIDTLVKNETPEEKKPEINDDIVCKEGVCFRKQKPDKEEEEEEAEKNHSKLDEEKKLTETRKYLEEKRRERVEEEKRLEKERELRRRKEGKEMQNLRAWQKDQELKELKENIKREKLEERAARERIMAQIAADKAERVHKFSVDTQATTSTETANNIKLSTVSGSDESRLQFRLASGACNTHNFKSSTTLSEIRDYVVSELLPGTGIKEFIMATTFPKRELASHYDTKTLTELELFPSAVILIIGKEATGPKAIISRNGGVLNMLYVAVMTVLSPIISMYNSAKNWWTGRRNESGNVQSGAQKRANEEQNPQNNASKNRNLDRFLTSGTGKTTGTSNQDQSNLTPSVSPGDAYRRYTGEPNIHRLSDNRKDSDDENATWNGNSTQQQ